LAIAAGPAAALGLGQIQVKSQPGQPLVAEIPIISSDPAELQGLQVRLASPETFRRVGLEPPQGLVSSLRFEPAIDAAGRPVIRVSSATAVEQPLLTFLVEVDWGQGRLVREYSALLDAPRTVSAPLQPPIKAATAAPANAIVRPATPVAATPEPSPPPAADRSTAASNAAPTPRPMTPPSAVAATPAPVPAAEPEPRADEYGPVKAGQTLGQIAATLDATRGYSAAQTMLALLRSNPDAFIGGNINRLKRGAILRVPQAGELAKLDRSEAAAVVHAQIAQWRDAQRPVPQPAAIASTGADAVSGRNTAATASVESRPAHDKPARTTSARLEIAPPSARSGKASGNQAMRSGIQAGGEGEMLRQQLQETKETLAARDAEVNELKTRVAELEKLQQQQQQLLTLKDSALAAAQQTLATSNRAQAKPAASTAQPTGQPAAQQPEQGRDTSWLFGGLALVLVALAGWLVMRRRRREDVIPRRTFDTAALAASLSVAATEPEPVVAEDVPDAAVAAASEVPEPASAQPETSPAGVPTWHGSSPPAEDAQETTLAKEGQQLELAQAYLDLGDDDAARALLRDVLDGRDPVARATAARLLRDL
jgi:pilus assembly protein FimV